MMRKKTNQSTKKRKLGLLLGVAIPLAGLLLAGLDSRLLLRKYTVDSPKVTAPVRIVLVTDLHSCRYGENQIQLIQAVRSQNPDIVLLSGDIFDEHQDSTNARQFLAGIAGLYPCYYVTGNHEYRCEPEAFAEIFQILKENQIKVLSGVWDTLTIKGQALNICGVDDPSAHTSVDLVEYAVGETQAPPDFLSQLDAVSKAGDNGTYSILLSHRPEYFEDYAARGFDLVLCGHAHGGQWRIPVLLNGLYAPGQGLFPKYAGGLFRQDATTMIVSRGLARETTMVPRFYNRPELVVIDLK